MYRTHILAIAAALAALTALSACGDTQPDCVAPCTEIADAYGDDASDATDANTSDTATADAGLDSEDTNDQTPTFSVPATEETANTFHTVDVQGSGANVIGDVAISDTVGTVEIHGRTVESFSYRRIPWPSENRTLYQTLAVAPDDIYVLWFYCSDAGDLREIWYEGTDGTKLEYENGSGSCSGDETSVQPTVRFPAVEMQLEELADGFEVEGMNVSVGSDGRGTVTFFDTTYETYVFDQVDCSVQCNSNEGWYELHSLMWSEDDGELYFGIFYLLDGGATVRLSYTIGIPSVFEPGQQQFPDATWTQL